MSDSGVKILSFLRGLVFVINIFCIVELLVAVTFSDYLDAFLKVWLLVIVFIASIGLNIALFLAPSDRFASLFLVVLLTFLSGIVTGVGIIIIVKKNV